MARETCPTMQTLFLTFGVSRSIHDNVTLPVFTMPNVYVMESPTPATPSSLSGMYEALTSDAQYVVRKT